MLRDGGQFLAVMNISRIACGARFFRFLLPFQLFGQAWFRLFHSCTNARKSERGALLISRLGRYVLGSGHLIRRSRGNIRLSRAVCFLSHGDGVITQFEGILSALSFTGARELQHKLPISVLSHYETMRPKKSRRPVAAASADGHRAAAGAMTVGDHDCPRPTALAQSRVPPAGPATRPTRAAAAFTGKLTRRVTVTSLSG